MKAQEANLLELLSGNNFIFFIPPYQRNYEWTREHCGVFLDDVVKTAQANLSGKQMEHFFGSITYCEKEKESSSFGLKKLTLIDGQQRITTVMLFLIAVRDKLGEDEQDLRSTIEDELLKNRKGREEHQIKLRQVEADWSVYKKIITKAELAEKEKSSAVYLNYKYFARKLDDLGRNGIRASDLINRGLSAFTVITVQLHPEQNAWENPQEIFESMNSLGKPLSLADLVRNYLLLGMSADEQVELYNKYWLHIEETIPNEISNFIRDYMQCVKGRDFHKAKEANYKELYRKFTDAFSEYDKRALLEDLARYSTIYSWISLGESSGNKRIDKILNDIRITGATTANSFLLGLLKEWKDGRLNDDDAEKLLSVLFVFLLRRRIMGLTGPENKTLPLLVKRFEEIEEAEDKEKIMYSILSMGEYNFRLPNDVECAKELSGMNFYDFRLGKFLLALIEEKITKSRPDMTAKTLQLEHIMPQKLTEEWRGELGENAEAVHQELLHSIGNLTLIHHNQELGAKSFAEKKLTYKNMEGLQIAKSQIEDCAHWDESSIRARGEWLIRQLLEKVLPVPEKYKNSSNYKMKESSRFSFAAIGLEKGETIYFARDPSYKAVIVNDREVAFGGEIYSTSKLTKVIQRIRGKLSPSQSYQGPRYWMYDGVLLADMEEKTEK